MQVSAVQREFVEKLLTKPVFQRHMTAVREVLNMLRAAQKIRGNGELYDDQAIKVRSLLTFNMAFSCLAQAPLAMQSLYTSDNYREQSQCIIINNALSRTLIPGLN